MRFGTSIGIFFNSANLICRSTDISKCFRGSLLLQDNESRLYLQEKAGQERPGLFNIVKILCCETTGPGYSKLTTSLVNTSLKF